MARPHEVIQGVPRPDRMPYRLDLALRAMSAVTPIFEQQKTPQAETDLFNSIMLGEVGHMGISLGIVEALKRVDLLKSMGSTTGDKDKPGWNDTSGNQRITSYAVILPWEESIKYGEGIDSGELSLFSGYSEGTDRSQERSGIDFTKWTLVRHADFQ